MVLISANGYLAAVFLGINLVSSVWINWFKVPESFLAAIMLSFVSYCSDKLHAIMLSFVFSALVNCSFSPCFSLSLSFWLSVCLCSFSLYLSPFICWTVCLSVSDGCQTHEQNHWAELTFNALLSQNENDWAPPVFPWYMLLVFCTFFWPIFSYAVPSLCQSVGYTPPIFSGQCQPAVRSLPINSAHVPIYMWVGLKPWFSLQISPIQPEI